MDGELRDQRMIDWLEDGPWDAPRELVDAAAAYALAHPRRRLRRAGPWRTAMNRMHLAPVEEHRTGRRSPYLAFAAIAAAVVLVVGVVSAASLWFRGPSGGQGGIGAPPAATPTPTPAPPSASPTARATSPIATLPANLPVPTDLTSSTQGCSVTTEGTEVQAGTWTLTHGVVLTCSYTSSDPRLTGTATVTAYIDQRPDDSAELWGTATLKNAYGSWTGPWTGTADAGYVDIRMTGLYLGAGAFDGLRVRWTQAEDGGGYALSGILETLDSVPPGGVPVLVGSSCSVASTGTTEIIGQVEQSRGVVLSCSNVVSDPRLGRTARVTVDIDQAADQSATLANRVEFSGEDGDWVGTAEGTVAPGYTTHRVSGIQLGTGDYAGLQFRYAQIGTPEAGYVMTGVIEPVP